MTTCPKCAYGQHDDADGKCPFVFPCIGAQLHDARIALAQADARLRAAVLAERKACLRDVDRELERVFSQGGREAEWTRHLVGSIDARIRARNKEE
jgi:hypothetical protein